MTAPNPGIEARLHLVQANRAAIYVMLCRAVSGGLLVGDAVVVVADTSDAVGLELGEAAAEKVGLNLREEAKRVEERDEISTAILVLTLDQAKGLFITSHPSVGKGLNRHPPPGCVRCVSIAAGAAMLVHTDVRPTAPIAEA